MATKADHAWLCPSLTTTAAAPFQGYATSKWQLVAMLAKEESLQCLCLVPEQLLRLCVSTLAGDGLLPEVGARVLGSPVVTSAVTSWVIPIFHSPGLLHSSSEQRAEGPQEGWR